jgi:DNA-binding NarL/FixJ family response regulator
LRELLSKREADVVRLVAEGLSNKEVSEQLGLSEHTIRNYLFRVFDKLGVSTRVELVLYCLQERRTSPSDNGFGR